MSSSILNKAVLDLVLGIDDVIDELDLVEQVQLLVAGGNEPVFFGMSKLQ